MDKRKGEIYIESKLSQDKQKHRGWFYDYKTKKYYRWDNSPWRRTA